MGKSNYSDELKRDAVHQIAVRGHPVREVSRRLGVSTHSLYKWLKQLSDLAMPASTVLLRQPDDRQPQRIIASRNWSILQEAPRDANHPTRPALRRRELLARVNDGLTELLCGQALGFRWFRLSLRMSLSSSSSATIFFSRAFSFSRLFISDN